MPTNILGHALNMIILLQGIGFHTHSSPTSMWPCRIVVGFVHVVVQLYAHPKQHVIMCMPIHIIA